MNNFTACQIFYHISETPGRVLPAPYFATSAIQTSDLSELVILMVYFCVGDMNPDQEQQVAVECSVGITPDLLEGER